MIGVLIGIVGASAAVGAWVVMASYAYCRLSNHMDLFVFPWDQWLDIAPDWNVNGWTKVYVVISAAIPTLLMAAAAYGVITRLKRSLIPSLYGKTGWANRDDMHKGGLQLRDKL